MDKPRLIQISQPATGEEEWLAVREPLETGWLTQGPKVAEFEKRFAARHEVKHALAATSCTTALHLILAAMEIGPGDEVIVPAFTWVATANVVVYCGAASTNGRRCCGCVVMSTTSTSSRARAMRMSSVT